MAPFQLRDETLRALRATRRVMTSATWLLGLEAEDEATRREAAMVALAVHHAVRKLEDAELAAIRDALVANEADLEAGRESLAAALDRLGRVRELLVAASAVLNTLAKVTNLIL